MAQVILRYINLLRRILGFRSYILVSNIFRNNWALVSYIKEPIIYLKDDAKELDGHSNKWESREIALILRSKGFNVEVVDWNDSKFRIKKNYKIVVDVGSNFADWHNELNPNCKRWLHLTGSYPTFQNNAEKERINALKKRKPGSSYSPKRYVVDYKKVIDSIETSDCCTLIGNKDTLLTYPKKYWKKISLVTVSASRITFVKKSNAEYVPPEKEFLWYFGSGAVHKGLDIVLEAFASKTDFVLNVVGNIDHENDFKKIYSNELYNTPNIRYFGYLDPTSDVFIDILRKCYCFIAPSCSESISTSVATCLQVGLYPVISKNVGVNLPSLCGTYLNNLTVKSVKSAIDSVSHMDDKVLARQISIMQEYSLSEYSRKMYSDRIIKFLDKIT